MDIWGCGGEEYPLSVLINAVCTENVCEGKGMRKRRDENLSAVSSGPGGPNYGFEDGFDVDLPKDYSFTVVIFMVDSA